MIGEEKIVRIAGKSTCLLMNLHLADIIVQLKAVHLMLIKSKQYQMMIKWT